MMKTSISSRVQRVRWWFNVIYSFPLNLRRSLEAFFHSNWSIRESLKLKENNRREMTFLISLQTINRSHRIEVIFKDKHSLSHSNSQETWRSTFSSGWGSCGDGQCTHHRLTFEKWRSPATCVSVSDQDFICEPHPTSRQCFQEKGYEQVWRVLCLGLRRRTVRLWWNGNSSLRCSTRRSVIIPFTFCRFNRQREDWEKRQPRLVVQRRNSSMWKCIDQCDEEEEEEDSIWCEFECTSTDWRTDLSSISWREGEEHLLTISLVDLRVLRDPIDFFVFVRKQLNKDSRLFISVNSLMDTLIVLNPLMNARLSWHCFDCWSMLGNDFVCRWTNICIPFSLHCLKENRYPDRSDAELCRSECFRLFRCSMCD